MTPPILRARAKPEIELDVDTDGAQILHSSWMAQKGTLSSDLISVARNFWFYYLLEFLLDFAEIFSYGSFFSHRTCLRSGITPFRIALPQPSHHTAANKSQTLISRRLPEEIK